MKEEEGVARRFANYLIQNARLPARDKRFHVSIPFAWAISYLAERIASELRESPEETFEDLIERRYRDAKDVLIKMMAREGEPIDGGKPDVDVCLDVMRSVARLVPRSMLGAVDANPCIVTYLVHYFRNIAASQLCLPKKPARPCTRSICDLLASRGLFYYLIESDTQTLQ